MVDKGDQVIAISIPIICMKPYLKRWKLSKFLCHSWITRELVKWNLL